MSIYIFSLVELAVCPQFWNGVEIDSRDFKVKNWLLPSLMSWRSNFVCAGNTKQWGDTGLLSKAAKYT